MTLSVTASSRPVTEVVLRGRPRARDIRRGARAKRIGELWCVAGHVRAAWRQAFVRYILVGASAGMMLVIVTSVMTRVAQRVLMRHPRDCCTSQFVEAFS